MQKKSCENYDTRHTFGAKDFRRNVTACKDGNDKRVQIIRFLGK